MRRRLIIPQSRRQTSTNPWTELPLMWTALPTTCRNPSQHDASITAAVRERLARYGEATSPGNLKQAKASSEPGRYAVSGGVARRGSTETIQDGSKARLQGNTGAYPAEMAADTPHIEMPEAMGTATVEFEVPAGNVIHGAETAGNDMTGITGSASGLHAQFRAQHHDGNLGEQLGTARVTQPLGQRRAKLLIRMPATRATMKPPRWSSRWTKKYRNWPAGWAWPRCGRWRPA